MAVPTKCLTYLRSAAKPAFCLLPVRIGKRPIADGTHFDDFDLKSVTISKTNDVAKIAD